MDALSIIHVKRSKQRPHTTEELEWWIQAYTAGEIPEYQMAAWLMAVCWQGMSPEETATLTRCMVQSGKELCWTIPDCVDKHSTGGVGDKVSLVLAPLVASLGGFVPMMAGRGLGHTGGTIDKLESIPGYQTNLSIEKFQEIVQGVGCSIVSASEELCLADRKLYALRDVTGTVSSIPLQTASILCKKIAERPQSLVLDVKYGMGSFQSNVEEAQQLAESMITTAEANGVLPTTCLLTRMDDFLGHAIGNWNEVCECLDMLKTGRGSSDLKTLVVCQAAQMLQHMGLHSQKSFDELAKMCLKQLNDGKAYPIFRKMVEAHGGDVKVLDHPELSPYHETKFKQEIFATHSGYLSVMDGHVLGMLGVQMGAGRKVADDPVDLGAGITFAKKVGDAVEQGDLLCTLFTNRPQIVGTVVREMQERVLSYSTEPIEVPQVISHRVTSDRGLEEFTIPVCIVEDLMKQQKGKGLKRCETQ